MRKGINGLSIMIADSLLLNPSDGSIYIFYNKSYDKLKLIYWDRNGFCLFYKILVRDRFKISQILSLRSLSYQQLRWLFDGLDIDNITGFQSVTYDRYY